MMKIEMKNVRHLFSLLLVICASFKIACSQPYQEWTAVHSSEVNGFIENKGQVKNQDGALRPDVLFVFSKGNFNLTLKKQGFSYELFQYEKEQRVSEATGYNEFTDNDNTSDKPVKKVTVQRFDASLIGSSDVMQVITEGASTDYFNYYHGNKSDAATKVHYYSRVCYRNIYPNIDLVFIAPEKRNDPPKYEYIIHPGGNVKNIMIQYNTLDDVLVKEGSLILPGRFGEVREENLFTYQNNRDHPVASSFNLKDNILSFNVGKYDHRSTLVIDPDIVWGTYYGENASQDKPQELSADEEGNVLVIGNTASQVNFATSGAYQDTYGGADYDAFVLKFSASGQRLWCTYFGGNDSEDGTNIYCDASSNVFAVGATYSADCPVYNAFQSSFGGIKDAFILALDKNGLIKWASYYGGSQPDVISAVDGDAAGSIYFTGWTQSSSKISTTGSHQPQKGLLMDAFLTKFNSSGMRLWSTYYGGNDTDRGHSVTVDKDNNVIMTGTSPSTTGIATAGSFQPAIGGMEDVFCVKFTDDGQRMWGTYFGGSNDDKGRAVVTDDEGTIYFTGFTISENNIASPDGWQLNLSDGGNGNEEVPDAFFAIINSEGTERVYSTYLGGTGEDYGISIRVKQDHSVLLSGSTYSTGLGTAGVWQPEKGGDQDAFIARFSATGQLDWFTYYGGPAYERGNGMDVTHDDFIYITGNTRSISGIATEGAYKDSLATDSVDDCMIAKFADHCTDKYEPNNSKNFATELTIPAQTESILINAQIGTVNDNDYYSFQNNATASNIRITLTSLPANYNLFLLNASGTELANSKKKGVMNEEIIFNNDLPDWYLVKVKGKGESNFNDSICYQLTVTLGDSPFRNQLFDDVALTESDSWKLYPCPASGEVSIDVSKLESEKINLRIYDLFGRLVYHEVLGASGLYSFDVSGWENGCYLVQLVNDDEVSDRILSVIH